MSEPHVTLNPRQLTPVQRKLRGPLEDQLTSALQAATEQVRETYAGEPVDAVCQRLLAETRSHLHHDIADAFQPDMVELRRIAQQIIQQANIPHHAAE